jgi:hypothetical protein
VLIWQSRAAARSPVNMEGPARAVPWVARVDEAQLA